jgi:hypothetical protein
VLQNVTREKIIRVTCEHLDDIEVEEDSKLGLIFQIITSEKRRYSHSGFEEPRGTSTVRNEPGVLDITTCSVKP